MQTALVLLGVLCAVWWSAGGVGPSVGLLKNSMHLHAGDRIGWPHHCSDIPVVCAAAQRFPIQHAPR
jgi:hypothetical protein